MGAESRVSVRQPEPGEQGDAGEPSVGTPRQDQQRAGLDSAATPLDPSVRIGVQGVTRVFRGARGTVEALGPVDLEIGEGEFVSVVGPSGCGKSTLLRVVGGLLPPTEGEVVVAHHDPSRNLMAMVPQENSVFPWKTVENNVRYGLDLAGRLPKKERRRITEYWIDRLGLSGFNGVYPSALSGGMKQRVAVARALAVEPEVLLMDEPFASLDAQLRTLLQDELLTLWEQDRRTVLFITHSIEEAIILSDRVIACSARPGRLTAEWKVPFDRPRDSQVRGTREFAALHEEIWEVLRGEVTAQMADRGEDEDVRKKLRGRFWRKAT